MLAMNLIMHPLMWVSSDLLCWHVSIAGVSKLTEMKLLLILILI